MENPIEMDDLGVPLICGNTHMFQLDWVLLHQVFDHLRIHGDFFFLAKLWWVRRPNGIPRGPGPFKLLDVFF